MKARLGDDRTDGDLLLGGKGVPPGQMGRGVVFGGGALAGTTARALLAAPVGPSLVAGGAPIGSVFVGGPTNGRANPAARSIP